MPALQYRYWILTIRKDLFDPKATLHKDIQYIKGQQEKGNNTGYEHWQLIVHSKKKMTTYGMSKIFPQCNIEPTRSKAAEDYVWKDDTKVEGTEFENGTPIINRNKKADWELVRTMAKEGDVENIPADIYVKYYNTLKRIKIDHEQPTHRGAVEIRLFLGPTGTGKTFRAWDEFGTEDTYSKISTTKWWDGYKGQGKVIIDEFRGVVSIGTLLRWLDPVGYPLSLEVKGGQVMAKFNKIILTSNIHPEQWYPELDRASKDALLRRINIIEINEPYRG